MWLKSCSIVSLMMKTMMWNSVGETRRETVYNVHDNITGFCASESDTD